MLYVLQSTLRRLEGSEEFPPHDPHVQELRRWLLVTIGDLEEQNQDRAVETECA